MILVYVLSMYFGIAQALMFLNSIACGFPAFTMTYLHLYTAGWFQQKGVTYTVISFDFHVLFKWPDLRWINPLKWSADLIFFYTRNVRTWMYKFLYKA